MKPAPFEYHAPGSVDEVMELLGEHGSDAKLLAGGQSLVPTMNFRLSEPSVLVDLNRVDGLSYVRGGAKDGPAGSGAPADSGTPSPPLRIGAMTRQSAVERSPEVATRAPLLAAAMPHIAHPQIRNRGTIGGSLAHADPAAELPAVAVALGARMTIRGQGGERQVGAADFFEGLFTTALGPEDLLVEIEVPPLPPRTGWAFQEVARRHGDYALVGVAATVTSSSDGRCEAARIVFLSVGGGPVTATGAQDLLAGGPLDDERIAEAARLAARQDIDPVGDMHASPAYRRHLAEVLARRALGEARQRASDRDE